MFASAKPSEWTDWIVIHSLAWLLVANLVGLLLASLLLVPRFGELLGSLTYGRWVPLHLDLHLYGWCSLPLVGLLFKVYLPASEARGPSWLPRPEASSRMAIGLWSACLVFAALWWLDGGSSGKLFLEWSGPARLFLAVNLGFLALVLSFGFVSQRLSAGPGRLVAAAGKVGLLAALYAVPGILFWASGQGVYPAFNPDSGGATGASLLGSTLGLVAIFCLTPLLLGLERGTGAASAGTVRAHTRTVVQTFGLLGLHWIWFLLLDHGNRSHHDVVQVVSLGSLVVWVPLLRRYLRSFRWPAASRPWLAALALWGALLVATGVVGFVPGVLERWKFTNAFVGHAHIAMAGLVTSFNVLVLMSLATRSGDSAPAAFAARRPFRLWHAGLAVQVGALFVLGTLEGFDPGLAPRGDWIATGLYWVRWLGGVAMVLASAEWLYAALGVRRPAVAPGAAIARVGSR